MAFGLQATGTNGIFQIDSNTTSTFHLAASNVGTTTTNNQAISGYAVGDLVMARPTSGSGTLVFDALTNVTAPKFNVPATYYIFKPSANASTSLNGSEFGLTVFNQTGTKIFDSRSFANSIPFTAIHQPGTFSGGDQPSAGATNNTVATYSNLTNFNKAYVMVNGGQYDNAGTIIQGFYFDNTNYKILFESFTFISFANIGSVPIPQFGAIMAGSLV
tara:strand:+ start:19 stop:669 length:651 start_codon:yes stop_codon:yes gene_type:complete